VLSSAHARYISKAHSEDLDNIGEFTELVASENITDSAAGLVQPLHGPHDYLPCSILNLSTTSFVVFMISRHPGESE
jgi:hypothetical protein